MRVMQIGTPLSLELFNLLDVLALWAIAQPSHVRFVLVPTV